MAGIGSVVLSGNITGGQDGARTFGPYTTPISSAVDETLPVTLSVGTNSIAVPSGATVCIIVGPNFAPPGFTQPNPNVSGSLYIGTSTSGQPLSTYGTQKFDWSGPTGGTSSPPSSLSIYATAAMTITVWFA